MSVPTEVGNYTEEHLRELASRPNTTVLQESHDRLRDPWPAARLRLVMERLTARVLAADDAVSDFALRKACLNDDSEILEFQRAHPKFYWMLTDRAIMREKRSREAVTGMLFVRDQIDSGAVAEGRTADAMAMRTVVEALQRGS